MSRDSAIHDLNLRVLESIHNTSGVFKDVVKMADEYTKAMKYAAKQGAKLAVALNSVAQQAASAKSTTHDLGIGVHEMAEAQRQLQRSNHTVGNEIVKISANVTGFLQQYEKEVKEWKNTYLTKCKQMEKAIREAEKKSKDKHIKKNQQDLLRQMNVISDQIKAYETMRQDALRETLIQERKRYCFILRQFSGMLKLESGFCGQNGRHLDAKLPEWVRLGAIAEILPPEAEELVKNPKRTLVAIGSGQPGYGDGGEGIYDDFAVGMDQWDDDGGNNQFGTIRSQGSSTSSQGQTVGMNRNSAYGGGGGGPPPPPMMGGGGPPPPPMMGGGGPPPPMMGGGGPPPPPMMGGGGPPPPQMGGGGGPPPPQMGGGGPPPPGGGGLGENEYRAQWSYHPDDPNGLHFEEGDIILVTAEPEDGWVFGEANGAEGWFPESFILG